MQITLVRHGQPEWTRANVAIVDPPLTEVGRAQAELVAKRLASGSYDHFLVSPLIRARQTAEPIAHALGREPEVLPWLAEIASPPWDGEPAEHIEAVFAEQRRRSVDDLWQGLDGGESFIDFHDRVCTGLTDYLASIGVESHHDQPQMWRLPDDDDRRIVIVAHGGTNGVLLGALLGIPPVPWEWERFHNYHSAIADLHSITMSDASAFALRGLNDLAHLPEDLRTM